MEKINLVAVLFIISNFNFLALHVLKLLNMLFLLPAIDSARHVNEAHVDITADVAGREEKLISSGYEKQISRDPLKDSQTESKHSHCLLSSQQRVNNTGSVARAVDNTSYNDRPKRYIPTSHVAIPMCITNM